LNKANQSQNEQITKTLLNRLVQVNRAVYCAGLGLVNPDLLNHGLNSEPVFGYGRFGGSGFCCMGYLSAGQASTGRTLADWACSFWAWALNTVLWAVCLHFGLDLLVLQEVWSGSIDPIQDRNDIN
jgi:hypothetical protein